MKTVARRVTVPGFEIREQHYVPGYHAPWHSHEEAEFCLVSYGHVTEDVDRGPRLVASKARGTFKPEGLRHRVDVPRKAAECIVISVSPRRFDDHGSLRPALREPLLLDTPRLERFGLAIAAELRTNDPFSAVALESLSLELLLLAARERDQKVAANVPSWLLQVRERLHDEPCDRYSLNDLAATAGVKPTALAQAFRRHYHTTVGSYVRELRIARAEDLLRKGAISIAEVSLSCGFYDQSHFTRAFRRAVGMAPGEYASQFRRSQ